MDTISRDNNSMLPIGGVIVGVIALAVGGYGAIKASSLQKTVNDQGVQVAKIDGLESQLGSVSASADKSTKDIQSLSRSTQDAMNTIAADLGNIHASITKLEEAQKARPVGKSGHSHEPVVAGPGEYVIKPGDSFAKIARANGCSIADIQAVNPDVNPSKLHPGQKIKLPQKK